MITLKLYGDESSDSTSARVFAIGAVFGTEDEWALAMRAWLRCTRGAKFHATDCESKYAHDPDPQKHRDNLALYKSLTTVLVDSHLVGIAVALDLSSFRRCLPVTPPETAYCKCFTDIVRHTGAMARGVAADELDSTFQYTFDSRLATDGTASQIYEAFRSLPEWAGTNVLGENIKFEDGDEPRLEVADLLARESMKELDRKLTGAREKRRSFEALENATLDGVRKFIFIEYDSEYCEQWRDQINGAQAQADRQAYERWLIDFGCVQSGHAHDTPANRARFYAWLVSKEVADAKAVRT